jgi:hypothetical protein
MLPSLPIQLLEQVTYIDNDSLRICADKLEKVGNTTDRMTYLSQLSYSEELRF